VLFGVDLVVFLGLTALVSDPASWGGRFGYGIPLVWPSGHGVRNIFVSAAFTPAEYHNSL
jgi:hypothetical protein